MTDTDMTKLRYLGSWDNFEGEWRFTPDKGYLTIDDLKSILANHHKLPDARQRMRSVVFEEEK